MEWVASTLHTTSVHDVLLPLMRTPRLPVVNRTDASAYLNGLVHFAERRNLVSAGVPSHFKRSLLHVEHTASFNTSRFSHIALTHSVWRSRQTAVVSLT